jgi:VCBS repeat-containing protein
MVAVAMPTGLKVSIRFTPQAKDDYLYFGEDSGGAGDDYGTDDLLANDSAVNAARVWGIFGQSESEVQNNIGTLVSNTQPNGDSSFTVGGADGVEVSYDADTGDIIFTFDPADFQYLADGESVDVGAFTYVIRMSNGAFSTAIAHIVVNGTNDAPVITVEDGDSDSEELDETDSGLTTFGTLTVTDVDASDEVSSSVTGVKLSGDFGALTEADVLAMLTLEPLTPLSADGDLNNLKWTFDSGLQAFNFLAADESLTLTYTITSDDGNGGTDTHDVAIVINGTNDAPVISVDAGDDDDAELDEADAGLKVSGSLTVTDLDDSDEVTSTVTDVALSGDTGALVKADVLGMLTLDPATAIAADSGDVNNLSWNFDSGSQAFDFLAVGESLTLTYTVTSDDGNGGSDSHNITVKITGTNDAPTSSDDSITTSEDITKILALTDFGTFADVDGDTIAAVKVTTLETNGSLEYLNGAIWEAVTLDQVISAADISGGKLRFVPNADENGSPYATIGFQVSDGIAFSVAAYTLTVNVTEVNDAPVATDDTLTSVAEDSGMRLISFASLLGNDDDGDAEAAQTLTITAVFNVVGGTAVINGTNIEFTPAANFNGTASFDYTVQDDGTTDGAANPKTDTGHASFTVTEVNDAPVATDDSLTSIAEDSGMRLISFASLLGNDDDGDPEVAQTLTITAVFNVVGGTAVINGTNIEFTPAANFNGTASFDYTVQDDGTTNGGSDPKTDTGHVSFTVTAVNDAPVLDAGKTPVGLAVLEDAGVPVGAVGTLVSSLVDFALPAGQVDNVTDVDAGALLGIAVTAADVTNGTWYYSADGGATWALLPAATNTAALLLTLGARLYFKPNANYDGDAAITFRAWDQTSGTAGTTADTSSNGDTTAFSSATDTAIFDVTPVADNLAPTDIALAVTAPSGNSLPNSAFATLSATDPDIGDTFAFSLAAGSSAGFSISGNTLTATSALADNQTYTLNIQVQDQGGTGNVYQETFNVITGSNAGENPLPSSGDSNPILTGDDILYGQGGADFIYGGSGNDSLFGQGDGDQLFGGAGDDKLDGGAGDDKITGGTGDDTIVVADGNDTVYFAGGLDGTDLIASFDGKSNGGQDFVDLDALFDLLGFSNADRAADEGFKVVGNDLWIDLDNNDATGANGGFEYRIATVTVADGAFDNADVIAGAT